MNLYIGITNKDNIVKDPYVYIDKDGKLDLWLSDELNFSYIDGDFRIFTKVSEKINFALASTTLNCEKFPMLNDTMKEIFPNFKEFNSNEQTCPCYNDDEGNEYPEEVLIYNPLTGNYVTTDGKIVVRNYEMEFYRMYTGELNEEDSNLLWDFLNDYKISLKEFLLNQKYIIIADKDKNLIHYINHNVLKNIISVYDNERRVFHESKKI